MKSLRLHPPTQSHTALKKFCEAMPHITKLTLTLAEEGHDGYDGVLRAIATKMRHLKYLDFSYNDVKPKAIEHLLPTEDNALGGCTELVDLHLWGRRTLDVELLKKIILALPKLRTLRHELLVNALGELTEEEMGADTARYLSSLYARYKYMYEEAKDLPVRYDILAKSPAFPRLRNNIITVNIEALPEKPSQVEFIADILMRLPKLRSLTVKYGSFFESKETHDVLPVLEAIGDRLKYLKLTYLLGSVSVQDVLTTCRNLVQLKLIQITKTHDSPGNVTNTHQDQMEKANKMPVLTHLTKVKLISLNKGVCSADMLIALLQSPWLNQVTLINIKDMSDDVMWNVFSSGGSAALARVTEFTVKICPLITAAPFVHWLTRENCSLQYMRFDGCEKVDCDVITTAAEKYPSPLILEWHLHRLLSWMVV